jgi:predicted phosphodiesterase
MRLHILSDLHIEFAPFQPPQTGADVVVIAGDVHPGKQGARWLLQTFTQTLVLYVLGNHEFYGQKTPKLIHEVKEITRGTNVHVLENDRVEIGDVVFLGATLWTDFAVTGNRAVAEAAAATGMTDFRRIRVEPSYRKFRPVDARILHARSIGWLEEQVRGAAGRRMVVVTHHAPSPRSLAASFRDDPLSAAYASDLEPLVTETGAALWIHGHLHRHSDYQVGSTRVVANPRGYPDEKDSGFDPALTVEI